MVHVGKIRYPTMVRFLLSSMGNGGGGYCCSPGWGGNCVLDACVVAGQLGGSIVSELHPHRRAGMGWDV